MALQPYRDRTAAKMIEDISEEATSHDVPLQVTYRFRGTQEWRTSKGHVVYREGIFQWHDVQGSVEPWPVQRDMQYGSFERLTGMAEEAISSTAEHAEAGITHTVNNAVAFMAQASSAASGSVQSGVAALSQQQQEFNRNQQQHFSNYEAARDEIEKQKVSLAQWETRLADQEAALLKKKEEVDKAAGAQKDKLAREFEKSEAKLAKERKELEEDKAEYDALLSDARSAQRRQARNKIERMLHGTPTQQEERRPQPKVHLTNGFGGGQKKSISFPQRNPFHYGDDEEDDDDDEDDYNDNQSAVSMATDTSFATARSQQELIVESDAFAYDPVAWRNRLSPDVIERILTYLRHSAHMRDDHWSAHIIHDHIITLRCLMHTALQVPALLNSKNFVNGILTILKRLFMFHETASGQSTTYINAFSEAVDGSSRPSWITAAQKQARRQQAAASVPIAPTRPTKATKPDAKKKRDGKN
jgi:hypothetical protein